jgi:hypothetical protein
MKIRIGFVSNSSSTSFALVMSKEDYCKALNEAPKDIQSAIFACGGPEFGSFNGTTIALINGVYGDVQELFSKSFRADRYSALDELLEILCKYPHIITEESR